jgi:hypothetical protein
MDDLGMGSGGEEIVGRATLGGLDVRERDPAQPVEWHDPFDRLAYEWEQ